MFLGFTGAAEWLEINGTRIGPLLTKFNVYKLKSIVFEVN
jgi:hypothetical protein